MLNFLDIIVITFIAISVLTSFFSGFLRSFLSLARLIISVAGAFYLRDLLTPFFYSFINDESIRNYLAYIASFLLLMVILSVLRRIIIEQMEWFAKGAVDRSMGATFGLLRAVVIVCAVFLVWMGGNGSIAIHYNEAKKPNKIEAQVNRMPEIVYEAASSKLITASTETIISIIPPSTWEKLSADLGINNQTSKLAKLKNDLKKQAIEAQQELAPQHEENPSDAELDSADQQALHKLLKKLSN